MKKRNSGLLLHPTSLPGKNGIGELGQEAFKFVDFLYETGTKYWQTLPLGPTGYGDSPYASRSSFAGNEKLISLDLLLEEGLLDKEDFKNRPSFEPQKVDYGKIVNWKTPLLFKAADKFLTRPNIEYDKFVKENSYYLEDYALFMYLSTKYNDQRWFSVWDKKYKYRDKIALEKIKKENNHILQSYYVLEYFFYSQWEAIKTYANSKGILIIGDIPIFVASDSCDTWTNPELFNFKKISGVPPDYFSPKGQLWGNPTYNWDIMKNNHYAWWVKRIKNLEKVCDIIRLDHFRGFASYWSVKNGSADATIGEWEKGPGCSFFQEIKRQVPNSKMIAEDLGFITSDVIKLLKKTGFPGMKILTFGYEIIDGKLNLKNNYLARNYHYNDAVYTGTHDNQTLVGWLENQDKITINVLLKYYNTDLKNLTNCILEDLFLSKAKYAIIPVQDLLKLDDKTRMNSPSTCSDKNWSWRLLEGQLNENVASYLNSLNKKTGRSK